ncbi:MAG: hypothetical protein E7062_01875 [Spirochaetaceae bacterium]|nr:hypothetical protein [Spirochaetaceae bacterium]
MKKKIENLIKNVSITTEGFIKITDSPVKTLTSEQKAILNRKGNVLFNQGDFFNARRLFITTGYSDGMTRIGDKLYEDGKLLEALKMYWLAHNARKYEPLLKLLAQTISSQIKE